MERTATASGPRPATPRGRDRLVSLGVTAERFPAGTHMCYVFNDDDERLEMIAKFVESGVRENEMVGYFSDLLPPDEARARLRAAGAELPASTDDRRLAIQPALATYCPSGRFEPAQMLDRLRTMYSSSMAEGYAGARATGEMTWALRGVAGSDRLIEYEALINTVVKEHPTTAICQYDARRFDGGTLFDVLSVHPMMVIRGQVVRNPYYIEPDRFLQKHLARHGA